MFDVADNEFASKDIASLDVAGTAFSPTVRMLFRDEREPAGGLHTIRVSEFQFVDSQAVYPILALPLCPYKPVREAVIVTESDALVLKFPETKIAWFTTVNGSVPLSKPSKAVPGFVIAAFLINPMMLLPILMDASTLIAGDT